MDPNAYTTPFQFTKSLRRDIYPAVDPKNPELKATGKTILITGATGGLGGVSDGTIQFALLVDTNSNNRKSQEPGLKPEQKASF